MTLHIFIYGLVIYSFALFGLYVLARRSILWVYEWRKNLKTKREAQESFDKWLAEKMRQIATGKRTETLSEMRGVWETNVMPSPLLPQVSIIATEIRLGQFNSDLPRLSHATSSGKRPKHTRSSHPKTRHRMARDAFTEEV